MTARELNEGPRPPQKSVLGRFGPVLFVAGLCWVVFGLNQMFWGGRLNQHGIVPRHLAGLSGILWAPFLHASMAHLFANTVPLLVLGGVLCARNPAEFVLVTLSGIIVSGGLTWAFARNACHIGASGLIFCFFGYLASLALFRRTFGTLLLSLVCLVAYGGMLKGLLPTSTPISWEGHIAGLFAGVLLAWIGSKVNPSRQPDESRPLGLNQTLR